MLRGLTSASCRMTRALSTAKPRQAPELGANRRLLPKKRATKRGKLSQYAQDPASLRVSAHLMANAHEQRELAETLRKRFGAGAVHSFGTADDLSDGMLPDDVGLIQGVVHLNCPSSGSEAQHGTANASAFFFTASSDPDGLSSSACVSVWWSAQDSFEEELLRDLRATVGSRWSASARRVRSAVGRQQQLDRLAIPRTVMKWQPASSSSALTVDDITKGSVITIDETSDHRSKVLDQLAFSHALERHMKLLLLEDEMERILNSVKRIVRQGLSRSLLSPVLRFLPYSMGGSDSGAGTMRRLLLMREFNFDDSVMSTPDWLWEQPAREKMYDDMVDEYEIGDRIEAINQQLDYAQATMQSLKDDAQHQHSTFLEWTIVLLIAFEVLVEMHALGWVEEPQWLARARGASPRSSSPTPP